MRIGRRTRLSAAVVVTALGVAACGGGGDGGDDGPTLASIEGVVVEAVDGAEHIQGDLDYPDSPPSGGDHNPIWQNCGFYDAPVFDETAVHALEHGVAWLAYSPDLGAEDLVRLRELFDLGNGRTLASPHPDVDVLEVVAWKHRLVVDDLDDPRIEEFIAVANDGSHSPEPGASCNEGLAEVSETGRP